ncbi:MAG: hypothetical protein L0Y58_17000 [Verrucomicrobia subdivision 3 bacterium]|nr:hypothetical protein [Limisphaerales bacterium]
MPKAKKLHASGAVTLKSVIIYDDLAFVAKANAMLQRVGSQPNVGAWWTVHKVPTHDLNNAPTAERRLMEAADAQLIVIPAQHVRAIPLRLREWLERWATLRQIQDAALVVIADGVAATFTKSASAGLAKFAQEHVLHFIFDEHTIAENATEISRSYSHADELPPPFQGYHFAYAIPRESFRGFGINE